MPHSYFENETTNYAMFLKCLYQALSKRVENCNRSGKELYRETGHEIMTIIIFTAIGLLPGCSGYFTCIQNTKLVTTKFKSGGLHEKHVVAN